MTSLEPRLTLAVDDPEDPLCWTKKRKFLQTICMVVYTVAMVFPSAAVYSVAKPISTSTGISITTINRGTGVMFLLYGWSTIFWQAVALQYGKRPVYLVSAAASVVVMAVAPMCRSSGTYLAIRILQVYLVTIAHDEICCTDCDRASLEGRSRVFVKSA
jgi:MFS family permease